MEAPQPFTSSNRKIDPARRRARQLFKPDGSPADPNRIEIGPTDLAFREWAERGIPAPDLDRMRQTRLQRTVTELNKRDLGGILLFDPLNIRYASDSSNMHLWIAHNPARAVFVAADGYMVIWDYKRCEHLSSYLPLIRETRSGAGMFYFVAGDKEDDIAATFATEVDDLMCGHAGRNRRLAVDKMELHGAFALQRLGLEISSGQSVMEHARLIKSEDEINAMRCAIATCEIAMAEMEKECRPGIAETELWAILHAENIKRGGEWIETRILSSGPRTNPWFQEAGPRRLEAGDLLAFDTDLIGPYGMCCDMSRTWFVGDGEPTPEQKRIYRDAHDHIMSNMQLLEPGISFSELTYLAKPLPEEYRWQRYGVLAHGVGLCDEFPSIYYPEDFIEGAYDYLLEPGMTLCVEVYAGVVGGRDGVKLEDQVLVTETGFENLSSYPFDDRLLC
ncbi:dimethylsulfonioproprionate lyase DddP [Oricola cellulosilytica]|uniref:Aminopeptidase P family protein n=1 Tax=Oricola cellulosilytica TaxID=1429082 RepID=A0A4R0PCP2_9HYPH|nr:dimethylsulfonioproprionate lyase DddP [Oricola cellulosilytica]TCD15240.1 aminopeptidase P family protein [Oricola cellulosilytica]